MHNTSTRRPGWVARSVMAAIAFGLAACGPFHRGSSPRTAVVFVNESIEQADVYASVSNANLVRLGTVLGTHTETLDVPPSVTAQGGQTRIVVRLLARSGQPSTGPITLLAGDTVRVRLPVGANTLVVTPGR